MEPTLEALDIGSRTFVQGVIDAVTMMVANGGHPIGFVILGFDSSPNDPAVLAATGFDAVMRDPAVRKVSAEVARDAVMEG